MLKVGITGNIGSGKSTCCDIFRLLGVPIYNADDRAKRLMTTDKALIASIQNLLGAEAYHPDMSLNRQYIASQVFDDSELLAQLNRLVHPAVDRDASTWFRDIALTGVGYALYEAALIYEVGQVDRFDRIILVTADIDIRVKRVMERDGVSRESVLQRIEKQIPDEEKLKNADFIIRNNGDERLIPQIINIDRVLAINALKS